MIPIEIELTNFLAYRQPGPLRLDGIHVACLAGPNGAGKSSLLDAITWSLWGKARTNAPDDLVHQGEDEMRVALTFEQEGLRYRVIRQRKSGKRGSSLLEFQIWEPDESAWRGISEATIRQTQEKIDSVLRLDYDTFLNSAFLMQGRADEFTTKTPTLRKQVLSNILGLALWELYEGRAKSRIAAAREEIQRLDGRLEEIDRELAQRETYEAELARVEAQAASASEKLAAAERQWADLEQARSELVALQRQIDDLTRRVVSTEREVEEAATELEQAKQQADKAAIQAALESVRTEQEALATQQAELEQHTADRAAAAEDAAGLKGINQALGPETEPLKERSAILEAASEPICPTCGQPLTEEHRQRLIEELTTEIEGRREQYRANQTRIRELEDHLAQLEERISGLQQFLRGRTEVERRAGELEAALNHADEAERRAKALEEKIARWQEALQADQARRSELEAQAEASEAQLKAAALTQQDLDQLRLEKRMADESVGGARQRLAALESLVELRVQRVEEREGLAIDLGLYEDLREAFSKRGVPAMIIETVVPELERSANELLGRMTDGRLHVRIETQREIKTGELREALDIIIADELGDRPYELYSGGEAFRINFAIRIALSRLLANRAGAQLRSLFIDEGFGTQDAQGREHLIEAINSIQDDFDRILVITHIDELKEAFPTRIEVRKTPQGSLFELV